MKRAWQQTTTNATRNTRFAFNTERAATPRVPPTTLAEATRDKCSQEICFQLRRKWLRRSPDRRDDKALTVTMSTVTMTIESRVKRWKQDGQPRVHTNRAASS